MPKRLPGLDILRFLAITAVFLFHYLFRGPISGWVEHASFPSAQTWAVYGYAGVDLFFVISGFVIAWSSEGRTALEFLRARFLRLWPTFVVCMTISALLLALAGNPHFPVGLWQWAANLIFLPQALRQPFVDGAYWSIVAELTFYGWIFLAISAGLWPRHIVAIGAGWLAVSLANLGLQSGIAERVLLTPYAGEFLGGVLLYRLRVDGRGSGRLALLAAAVAVSVTQSIAHARVVAASYGYAPDPLVVGSIHIAIFALVAVFAAIRLPARAASAAVMIGGVTYPAYLLHQNLGYVAIDRLVPTGLSPWAAVGVVSAAVLLAAWAIWRHVETPGRRMAASLVDPLLARLSQSAALLRLRLGRPGLQPGE